MINRIKKQEMLVLFFLITLIYVLLNCVLYPNIFIQGRFLAEEGTLFWAHSQNVNIFKHVFYIQPMSGYFLLVTNLITSISSIFSINVEPLITVWLSFLIMLLPAFIFALFNPTNLKSRTRLGMLMILVFSNAINTPEAIANSINVQIYLAISVAIIACFWNPNSTSRKLNSFVLLVLVIALLTGWYSYLFIPVLIWRIWRSNYRTTVNGIVLFGLIVQFWSIYYLNSQDMLYPRVGHQYNLFEYIKYYIFAAAYSINGEMASVRFIFLGKMFSANILIVGLILLLMFAFACVKVKTFALNTRIILLQLVTFLFTSITFIYIAGAGHYIYGRYIVLPSLFFSLIIVLICFEIDLSSRILSNFAYSFLVILLSTGNFLSGMFSENIFLKCGNNCVSWSIQVDAVRNGNQEKYFFWPTSEPNPWFVNAQSPKPRLADFQLQALKEG